MPRPLDTEKLVLLRPLYSMSLENTPGSKFNPKGHAGLWFDRFFDIYQHEDQEKWKVAKEAKNTWLTQFAKYRQVGDENALEQAVRRQMGLNRSLGGVECVFETQWHFVTGMGNSHPIENGFSWHPTLGVPYLSGATVKGMVRSWLEAWEPSDSDAEQQQRLLQWFGSTCKDPNQADYQVQTGELIFFDAIPVQAVSLGVDIMTSHMGNWYVKGQDINSIDKPPEVIPADWHDPVPIPFLVTRQARFLFSIALRRRHQDIDKNIDLELVKEALTNALEWLGAGAKTAVGYGQMTPDINYYNKLKQNYDHQCEAQQKVKNAEQALAQFESLSDNNKQLHQLQQELEIYIKANSLIRQAMLQSFKAMCNSLIDESVAWPSEKDRKSAVELLTNIYEEIGWSETGRNKKQREKQKQKKLDKLDAILKGVQ